MVVTRAEVLCRGVVPHDALALEIGPLDRPVLKKSKYDVRYIDFTGTDELRVRYENDPGVGEVLGVDLLWDGVPPLVSVVGDDRFDAVIASHVIEHIPNPVRWLGELASVLRPGGLVNLAIPDKRVTFDVNRRLTEASDWVDAFIRDSPQPSYLQVFDFQTKVVTPADALRLWQGTVDYSDRTPSAELARHSLKNCLELREDGPHADIHCTVVTPSSFVDLVEQMGDLELLEYSVLELVPTPPNTIEFYVRLERLDPELPASENAQIRAAGIARARAQIASQVAPAPNPPSAMGVQREGAPPLVVSDRERELIEFKRAAAYRMRAVARAVRNKLRQLRQ